MLIYVVSDTIEQGRLLGHARRVTHRARMWYLKLLNPPLLVEVEPEPWKPKNPECLAVFEEYRSKHVEGLLKSKGVVDRKEVENPGQEFWERPDVPSFAMPDGVVTHVSTQAWRELTEKIRISQRPGWERHLELANTVLEQLENGASSGVSGQGLWPIKEDNCFQEPETDIPRVMDALFSAIKAETIAGPFEPTEERCWRINSFLSVPKPGGDRRQVGDLSRPGVTKTIADRSFNGNVDPSLRSCWPLEQINAKQFSFMVMSMGRGAWMGKSDLSQAYKCLPVTEEQRRLQCFLFGGRVFTELRLIFGDTYAPLFFDRFHHVILVAFVTGPNRFPRCCWNKCIDDVPVTVPESKEQWMKEHFGTYRRVCNQLGVKLSPMDNASKSFEASQIGEVLGISFNTQDMTWSLPERKRITLVRLLRTLIDEENSWNLKEAERLVGKLEDVMQLWRPGRFFIDSFLKFKNSLMDKKAGFPSRTVKRDGRVWLACLEVGEFPILAQKVEPPPEHLRTYSDASGEIRNSPGIGLLIPAQMGHSPRVAAWEFPAGFLNTVDEKGAKCYAKTCCLESLGLVSILLLAPRLLQGRNVVHVMDNASACLSWRRGRSIVDAWATTLVRAAAHVCAFLNVQLYTEWQPRRSDRPTEVVDDLSHDLCESLSRAELVAYLKEEQVGFPEPLLLWLRAPKVDLNLGVRLVEWLTARG